MFKKSNRNFRLKKADSDNDDEKNRTITLSDGDDDDDTKSSNLNEDVKFKKRIETTKTTTITKSSILSFDLEEEAENGEVFKVKKSKESRRIAKEKKKEKKENKISEETILIKEQVTSVEKSIAVEDVLFNEGIKLKPLKINSNLNENLKNLTFTSGSKKVVIDDTKDAEDYDEKLQRLREEMAGLVGEDAFEDAIDEETDDAKRSMKILLKSGQIPDANMIHEARKKRQMARLEGEYIQVDETEHEQGKSTRMVREDDENEVSDEEDRVSFNVLEKSNRERQITRDTFLQYEQGSDKEDDDEEEDVYERWEREQIRKGVQITQSVLTKTASSTAHGSALLESYIGLSIHQQQVDDDEQKKKFEINLTNLPVVTFESTKKTIRQDLESIDSSYRSHLQEKTMITENLNASQDTVIDAKMNKPKYNEQYVFYQEMKLYLIDLVDCFNEKLYEIENIENNIISLNEARSHRFQIRNRNDVQDENTEIVLADELNTRKYNDAAHQRRSTERENRRYRRKQLKTSSLELHFDGLSSDDEETPSDIADYNHKKNDLMSKVPNIFNDVLDDFHDLSIIKSRFDEWRVKYPDTYEDAYVDLSMPKLLSILIRVELIDWNPLENETVLNEHEWYKILEKDETNEADQILISRLIEKVIFDKLKIIIQKVYYPHSTKHNVNLTNLFKFILNKFSNLKQSQHFQKVTDVVVTRIRGSFDNDVFIPLFKKQVIDNKASLDSQFFYRQFWSCIKLFSNILLWEDIISDQLLQELSLDCLLNRYVIVALQYMDPCIETVEKIEYITKKLPQKWFENLDKNQTLTKLNNLCRLLHRIAASMQQNVKANKLDSKLFKDQIRQIRKLFMSIHAIDHAIELTNTYQIK